MTAILRIAAATFHESIRRRYLNIMLVFALGMIALSALFAHLSPGAELKMLLDMGIGSIRFFGMLIAVFLGVRMISDEVERRTVDVLLSKPVSRSEFVVGKFLGGLLTLLLNMAIMTALFAIVYAIKAPAIQHEGEAAQQIGQTTGFELKATTINVFVQIVLVAFEMAILVALAVAVSTVASWIFSAVFTLFLWVSGQFGGFLDYLSRTTHSHGGPGQEQWASEASPLVRIFALVTYRLLPHFDQFDVREAILSNNGIPLGDVGMIVGHAVIYMAVVIAAGCLLFSRRQF